jgi:nuclear pore complex protein Nup205
MFKSKINLLVWVASNPAGAELLLQAGLMGWLAEFSVLDLRPDPDSSLLRGGEEEEGSLHKYQSVLLPVLRLCQAVLASLGADNVSAVAQTVQFLTGHEEVVSLVCRGSTARASLHPLLLQELTLLTAVVSRVRSWTSGQTRWMPPTLSCRASCHT